MLVTVLLDVTSTAPFAAVTVMVSLTLPTARTKSTVGSRPSLTGMSSFLTVLKPVKLAVIV